MTTTKTAAASPETFYGTDDETYYCDARGRLWVIQSPDLVGMEDVQRVPSLPDSAEEVDSSLCFDLMDTAADLDTRDE